MRGQVDSEFISGDTTDSSPDRISFDVASLSGPDISITELDFIALALRDPIAFEGTGLPVDIELSDFSERSLVIGFVGHILLSRDHALVTATLDTLSVEFIVHFFTCFSLSLNRD